MSDDHFAGHMRESVAKFSKIRRSTRNSGSRSRRDCSIWPEMSGRPEYVQRLADAFEEVEKARRPAAISSSISRRSRASMRRSPKESARPNLAKGDGWRRIIIEKPFGHDLVERARIEPPMQKVFDEEQIYRIDHYLGKETVQNILAFRFGNGIFEPIWNRRYMEHVQITAAESIGVEGSGAYYQEAGALRDMVQNHLLQVMATVAMEPSAAFSADAVRDERAKLLRSIQDHEAGRGGGQCRPRPVWPGRVGGEAIRDSVRRKA